MCSVKFPVLRNGEISYVYLPFSVGVLPHSEVFNQKVQKTLRQLSKIEYSPDTYWKEIRIWFKSLPAAIDHAMRGEEGGGNYNDYC